MIARLRASAVEACCWPAWTALDRLHTSLASEFSVHAFHVYFPLVLGAALLFRVAPWFVMVVMVAAELPV